MAEEIDVENGRNSNFEGLVTLTLTFDPAIPHTIVHHSSTSTYIPNFIQIEVTFCTYGRTYGRTDISPLYIIRSTLGSRPNNMKLAVDGCAVTFGTARRGLGGAAAHPDPSSLYKNVTAHPSTASVPITVLLCSAVLTCPLKG